ncbi:protein COFACTOR ASSEMBLY OF COMPLEX C SUBUNIT B CCB4, chloroplastic isoform X2 [Tripterygium wilfordii]|uniref:protein COFACTOR ASSEMBLY OF COMPLEX C SUBUNIT B CCB4, chloroplastic isoform X2 n=1 Tax=Tripterygium wilfordii TaxID=458696 RepID=UPI0018F7FFF1|nr:protein COFACTOR ASSEMBLY OF COMPLEX C SUBUNIT B CCB4, chloroplastic isoform X2 [Tripterygium wilfordii]
MEAGTIANSPIQWSSVRPLCNRPATNSLSFIRASSNSLNEGRYRGPKPRRDWVADWVSNNDDVVRSLPIYVGGVSMLAVLFNRTVSGIAPVADASSSQSRADLLTLGLAVTNILAGLVWLSIRPKSISVVNPQGVECQLISPQLPDSVVSELLWVWDSLSAVTCCRSLVVVYDCTCILQIGVAAESHNDCEPLAVDASQLVQGSLYQSVMKSGALILQPLGDKGIAIIGGDMIRGFTTLDQAWITFIGEKLDATLGKYLINDTLAVQERN